VRYRTIVADPPWEYRNVRGTQTRSKIGRRAITAAGNYATMSTNAIAALPVADLADDRAHVYLWVTTPLLFSVEPHRILEAWGFEYVTLLTWVKTGPPGMGFYYRGHTEYVLFGIRGKLGIEAACRERNVFEAPRRGHSAKPDAFYDLVERVSPEPRVELFARRARFGWDYWGDQSLGTAELPSKETA
jgi:N6-adenosine-specific RNA methylase IME4